MDMIILTFIVAEPSNCTDFISTPFIPFLPSLERRLRKHRRMQKPQMPRIMRAMRMKMATTPHPGMPVFSPMKSAACIVLSWTFVRVDTVEDSTVEDSSVMYQVWLVFKNANCDGIYYRPVRLMLVSWVVWSVCEDVFRRFSWQVSSTLNHLRSLLLAPRA